MLAILTITMPIFIIMAMGYFSVRFDFFTEVQLAGIGKFVIRIGLPMLVFHAITTRPLQSIALIAEFGPPLPKGLAQPGDVAVGRLARGFRHPGAPRLRVRKPADTRIVRSALGRIRLFLRR